MKKKATKKEMVQVEKTESPGRLVQGMPAILLGRDGVMRWQRAIVPLHVQDGTLCAMEIRRQTHWVISAQGYQRLNQITRVMPVQSPDVMCDPAPPEPLDVVTVKGSAVGYVGGSVAVHSLVLRYDIRARLLHQLLSKARYSPEVARLGTKDGFFPEPKTGRGGWAYYALDSTSGVWVDLRAGEIAEVLIKIQQTRVMADRYARTHWERNIIRTYMPGVKMDCTSEYDRKTDTAEVIVEGYYPDQTVDVREAHQLLVDIAAGRVDGMRAKLGQYAVMMGAVTNVVVNTSEGDEQIEDATHLCEAAGDPLAPVANPDDDARRVTQDMTVTNLLSQIDAMCFFELTPDQAKTIHDKYAPLNRQPVDKLRAAHAECETMTKANGKK